jgi:hypothetical protein
MAAVQSSDDSTTDLDEYVDGREKPGKEGETEEEEDSEEEVETEEEEEKEKEEEEK